MDNKKELAELAKRLIAEYKELQDKLSRLGDFKFTEAYQKLDATDRRLLLEQQDTMRNYADILNARIDHLQLIRIIEHLGGE